MKFTKKYDWMYRRMTANLPANDICRNTFERWWNDLGKLVDTEKENKE